MIKLRRKSHWDLLQISPRRNLILREVKKMKIWKNRVKG